MLSFKTDPTALHLHSPHHSSLPPSAFKKKPHQHLQEPPKLTKKPKEENLCTPALPLPFLHDTRFRNHSFQKVLSAIVRTKASFYPQHITLLLVNDGSATTAERGTTDPQRRQHTQRERDGRERERERRTLARAAKEIRGCKARFGTAGKML